MPKSWGLPGKNTDDLAGGGGVIMGLVNLHFILLKVNRAWDQTPVTPVTWEWAGRGRGRGRGTAILVSGRENYLVCTRELRFLEKTKTLKP